MDKIQILMFSHFNIQSKGTISVLCQEKGRTVERSPPTGHITLFLPSLKCFLLQQIKIAL